MFKFHHPFYFAPDDQAGGGDGTEGAEEEQEGTEGEEQGQEQDFEEDVLPTLSEEQQKVYASHIQNLKSALKKERAAAKITGKDRQRLQQLEQAEAERKKKSMTSEEQAKAEKATADQRVKQLEDDLKYERMHTVVVSVAGSMKFIDPEDAFILMDLDSLEIDDKTGKVSGVKEALEELAKRKPHLISGEPRQQQAFNTDGKAKGTAPKTASLEDIKKRKRAQYGSL